MTHTNFIKAQNSNKSVYFIPNGGNMSDIIAMAQQDGEYWYTIGHYKSAKSAKTFADPKELKALVIE